MSTNLVDAQEASESEAQARGNQENKACEAGTPAYSLQSMTGHFQHVDMLYDGGHLRLFHPEQASISTLKVEAQHSESTDSAVGLVKAKTDCVHSSLNAAGGKIHGHLQSAESTPDAAVLFGDNP